MFFANSEDHAWPQLLVTCHGKIAAEQICHFLHILVNKLNNLGLTITLCCWILDFLTNRPQNVSVSNYPSAALTLSTGAPQGCVLGPALFTLFTHDCTRIYPSNSIVKLADDTTIVGLITG